MVSPPVYPVAQLTACGSPCLRAGRAWRGYRRVVDMAMASREELLAIIAQQQTTIVALRAQVAALLARVRALEDRLASDSRNSDSSTLRRQQRPVLAALRATLLGTRPMPATT